MSIFAIGPNTFRFTLLLGFLAALPSVSIDISAPTLLVVQQQFLVPSSIVGLTITLFMIGFAFGQFGAGPLSDRYGRRPALLVGLVGYTVAALGCSLAGTAHGLLAWRLIQGVAAGSCAVLAFAMIRDLFEGDVARSKRSYVTVVFGLAPMLAPALGAWILQVAGWRPVYIVLSACGAILLTAVLFCVAESRKPVSVSVDQPVRAASFRSAYRQVLVDRRFLGLATVNALSFGAMFAYIAGSPLVLMGDMHLTPSSYSVVFASTAASLTLGAWVSGRCANAGVSSRSLLWVSLVLATVSAMALVLLMALHVRSLPLLFPLLLTNLFCRGMVAPNAQHMALDPMRENAGTAAATVGVMQILTGALSSAFVAVLLPYLGPLAMTGVMTLMAMSSLTLWIWFSMTEASSTRLASQDA